MRNCEWVFCELKCEPARDWSAIFRITRSFPGANAIAHNRIFVPETRHAYSHTTRVYAMYATITVVISKALKSTCASSLVRNGELDLAVI